jgi:hypothetical protein
MNADLHGAIAFGLGHRIHRRRRKREDAKTSHIAAEESQIDADDASMEGGSGVGDGISALQGTEHQCGAGVSPAWGGSIPGSWHDPPARETRSPHFARARSSIRSWLIRSGRRPPCHPERASAAERVEGSPEGARVVLSFGGSRVNGATFRPWGDPSTRAEALAQDDRELCLRASVVKIDRFRHRTRQRRSRIQQRVTPTPGRQCWEGL